MQSPKKRNLDQNINNSKSHLWNSFFENIISDIQLFYIRSNVPVNIIRAFLISDLLAEILKAKTNLSFYNTVLLKKTSLILRTSTRLALGIICYRNTTKNLSEFTNFLRLQSLHISFAVSKNNNNKNNKTKTKNKTKQKTFALHHFLKAKNCIPVCIFLYIFISVYLLEKMFVPET